MTDGEMILWLVTKGTMEDKPVLHLAADRIQALTAEREELVECNEQFSVDNHFLKKRIEALTAERDEFKRLALIADTVARECKIHEARAEKAEADNDRAWAALWDILACETPNANATVTRMVAIAKAALKGESHD